MASRVEKQKYTPAKVGVTPPTKGMSPKASKKDSGGGNKKKGC